MGNKKIVGISLIALAVMTGCSEQKKASNELDSDTTQQVEVTDLKAETLIAVSPKAVKTEALSTKELNAVQYQSSSDSLVSSSKVKRQQPMVLAENIALGGIDGALAPMPMMDENYQKTPSNGVIQTVTEPLSTFSIDVDTGSYANVRNQLNNGYKPVSDAIREEAFINYFDYDYPVSEDRGQPFSVNTEIAASPWNKDRQLLRIALKGYEIPADARKPSNLVFLIDTSGSMHSQNKLPLLKRSLVMLTKELNENDAVSLVTYAGSSKVVLEPTKGSDKQTIINAINQLTSGGGTAGESGIRLAYQQARAGFINDGVNRIMLATDGDFNIGISSIDKLKEIVASERKQGVSLTTLGFGRGNYNDSLMEQLADIGDGNYAYIDSIRESRKVFHHQMSGTLQTIASDVKAQIEFNPNVVKEYRLIGYQNRLLDKADFNNDAIDAGEIGAGHTVT
ncbi:von Willebrand factor type A domain-containing protein, partial [Vibrio rotiferianus]